MMISIAAGILDVLLIGVAVAFFVACYRIGMGEDAGPFADRRNAAIFAGAAIIALLLCYSVVSQHHTVYYWDIGNYWTLSYTTMRDFFAHPLEALKHVHHSIAYDDYNTLLPLFLALPLKLFGHAFFDYVMLVCTCFLIPAAFLLSSVAWKMLPQEQRRPQVYAAILFIIFTFNALYGASLYGYADVACLLPAALALLLAVDCDLSAWGRVQKRRDICLGLLFACAFLMRRYFPYFVIGYMAALIVCAVPSLWARGLRSLRAAMANLGLIGITTLGALLIICEPMIRHILSTNYASQYESYDRPFLEKITGITDYFGLIVMAAAIIAVLLAFLMRRWRRMTCLAFISCIVTALCFFKVQAMGVNHFYTLCSQLVLLLFLAWVQISCLLRERARRAFSAFFGIVLLVGTLHGFCLMPQTLPPVLAAVYPVRTFQPLQRSDLSELRALADYLNAQADPEGRMIYVLSSGDTLNAGILDALDRPASEKAVHHMVRTHDADLRDGFPADFLHASIVVVTDPVDLHLTPGTQEVVRYLAEEVQDAASPVGRHFEKGDRVFTLEGGRKAYIYYKVSDFSQEDLQSLADYYTERYPGQEKLFSDRIFSGKE